MVMGYGGVINGWMVRGCDKWLDWVDGCGINGCCGWY